MVRIKHRYLLFHILYPSPPTSSSSSSSTDAPAAPRAPGSTPKESPTPAYILFHRPSPGYLTPALLVTHLRGQIQTLFGDHGVSVTQSALRLVYFSPATSTGILRVPRAHFRLVWASMTFVTSMPAPHARSGATGGRRGGGGALSDTMTHPELACVIRVVRVSGTIRKSEDELLRRARTDVVRAKLQGRSLGEEGDDTILEGIFAGVDGKSLLKGKDKADAAGSVGGDESIVDFEEDEDFEDDSG
ncbi:hypothetical protein Z517_05303 [Fonsecaea pedrosoi CBS 271.37]|uniref:Uncharacterized protein n=1 Tax=Fonsecaea pedrosoi CBS 271.37 TaxID=1442368 RepID=A0A0D2DWN6_9EURO|nr:uncharacterized protein Z517_05303 [Fonsecaea pedrosoi CBS 271.37]KIW82276.1 hypothetical protein Z517_05303 [Fonsecaea pedrosoi CBS 271.37]